MRGQEMRGRTIRVAILKEPEFDLLKKEWMYRIDIDNYTFLVYESELESDRE